MWHEGERFRWHDGERVILFGEAPTPDLLGGPGYTLLTTKRADAAAPQISEGAGAMHLVGQGRVDEIAASLRPSITGELLVAFGGGRVIDVAKALAAADPPRRVAAIPTTLSGAEMTAVHRHVAGLPLDTPRVRPALVINDPSLCASQPMAELACSAGNALGHALEGPLTPLRNPVATIASVEAIRLIGRGLPAGVPGAGVPAAEIAGAGVPRAGVPAAEIAGAGVAGAGVPAAEIASADVPGAGVAGAGVPEADTHEDASAPAGEPDRPALALGALLAGYVIGSTGYGLHHVMSQTLVRFAGAGHGAANSILLPFTLQALARRFPSELDHLNAAPLAERIAALTGATRLREIGVSEEALERCADEAAGRPELHLTPPAADRDEILTIYRSAW
jgi:alcohol dehydrogenase class IV